MALALPPTAAKVFLRIGYVHKRSAHGPSVEVEQFNRTSPNGRVVLQLEASDERSVPEAAFRT